MISGAAGPPTLPLCEGAQGGGERGRNNKMSDNIFNRPRRPIEPRIRDEHGRDFGDPSHPPDQGAAERRDPGADALSELERLIGDPRAPIPGGSGDGAGERLGDVLRAASSPTAGPRDSFSRPPAREQAQSQDRPREGRSYEDRRSSLDRGVRRDSDFAPPRVPVQPIEADTDHSERPHASDDFDFLRLPDRDDYAVAPRQAMADGADNDLREPSESSSAGRRHPAYGQEHEAYADEYGEDEYRQDADGEYEGEQDNPDDGEPGVKRRSATKVAIAVLGLAVFGSAAAFGYRTVFKAAPSGPTPIIRADNSPTKITPVGPDAESRPANGTSGDRSGEQLVRRDEEPVNVDSLYRNRTADAGYRPGLADAAAPPSPEIVPATVNPAPSGGPKPVRTVPIRVDQNAPSDRTTSDRATSDRATSRSSRAAVPPPQAPPPQSPSPLPAPSRQAALSPPPSSALPPAGDSRMGAGIPVATAPEAAPSRTVETGGFQGGFVVQLSAQRSEADAQSAFRALQTKYSVLSGRELVIRRKDLGERGIFFAAQVGPFGGKSEADQLCETLKAAGGSCFVQKN
jgi:SPOR domain